jgi:hypothetical protein
MRAEKSAMVGLAMAVWTVRDLSTWIKRKWRAAIVPRDTVTDFEIKQGRPSFFVERGLRWAFASCRFDPFATPSGNDRYLRIPAVGPTVCEGLNRSSCPTNGVGNQSADFG